MLSRRRGLERVAEEVRFVEGDGVEGVREFEGMGDEGGEWGVPIDLMRREGGVGTLGDE